MPSWSRTRWICFCSIASLIGVVIPRVWLLPLSSWIGVPVGPRDSNSSWTRSGAWASLNVYSATLLPASITTLLLAWKTRPKANESLPAAFNSFMREYLPVWYLAAAADWLQGPYVYALYAAYGHPTQDIALLFVAGFASSMIGGALVGPLADTWGRKRSCLLYCVMYIVTCLTKHFRQFSILMFGRIAGGLATSILFSGFESWMVSEHLQRHNFSSSLLSYIFSKMFFGMYAVAILTGVVAQLFVDAVPMWESAIMQDLYFGGYVIPFDLSMICTAVCIFPIAFSWRENYGSEGGGSSIMTLLRDATGAVMSDTHIALTGLVVCGFEASMYCFVSNWTPALESEELPLPHGLVFSMFMMACMCGSSAFALLGNGTSSSAAAMMLPVLLLGAASIGSVAVAMAWNETPLHHVLFACFMLFEFSVGCYWPIVGTLKSDVVPESVRSTVYNLYRIPLNLLVCGLLLGNMSLFQSFSLCTALLVGASMGILPLRRSARMKQEHSI